MTNLEMKVNALARVITADNEETKSAALAELTELLELGEDTGYQEYGRDYYMDVTKVLNKLGVNTSILGYGYLRDAILLAIDKPKLTWKMTREFYPAVGRRNNTTGGKVERSIRHAIESCFERSDYKLLESYFGNAVNPNKGKLTNKEFISLVAEKVRVYGAAMH